MVGEEPQSFDRVLSSMCTEPHPAARAAAVRFLATNPGDPETYPAVARLEAKAVASLGEIAGLEEPMGYIASGGTEANIQAVRAARNLLDRPNPNIVVPENGHFSFRKAAEILDVSIRPTPLTDENVADVDAMAEAIDSATVLLTGVAGSTEYGRVDPIPAIAELAVDHGIHCHVDAAWGGFILPFTDIPWNFADAPVDSLTIDPHKMGRAAIPSGGFLARNRDVLDALAVETPYLESETQYTLGGTRSGAGVASVVAAFDELWPDGYERQFERCQSNANWLASALTGQGFAVDDPSLPIVVADIPDRVFTALRTGGWRIARTSTGKLRIVCMPHVTRDDLEAFLDDLDAAMST